MKMIEVPEDNLSIATRLLAALKGYTARQTLLPDDLGVITDLLEQWDGQVQLLEGACGDLQATMLTQSEHIAALEHLNDELRASVGLKGMVSYLKRQAGLA